CIDSLDVVEEGRRRLMALRKYLTDRASRVELQASERWCEVRIGELLGPGESTQGQRRDLSPTGDKLDGIPREDRHKFRLMAAHRPIVEEAIGEGVVTRNK